MNEYLTIITVMFVYNKIMWFYNRIFRDHKNHFKAQIREVKYVGMLEYTKFFCYHCKLFYWYEIEDKKRGRF